MLSTTPSCIIISTGGPDHTSFHLVLLRILLVASLLFYAVATALFGTVRLVVRRRKLTITLFLKYGLGHVYRCDMQRVFA